MEKRENTTEKKWIDPDDAPALTEEWFANAGTYRGGRLVRRGRPRKDNPKQPISLRLDPDVIEAYRASGLGWQTRLNDDLRKAVGL